MSTKAEERYNKIRIIVSILTLIGGCLAFVISNYLTSKNLILQQKEEQQREFKRLVLSDRVTIYKEVCKAVGQIIGAAEADTSEFNKCYNDFEKLYWGEFSLVEDSTVFIAGNEFRAVCRSLLMASRQEADIIILKQKASNFTTACRKATANSWETLFKK